jgi:hypothetical protein
MGDIWDIYMRDVWEMYEGYMGDIRGYLRKYGSI